MKTPDKDTLDFAREFCRKLARDLEAEELAAKARKDGQKGRAASTRTPESQTNPPEHTDKKPVQP